MPSARKPTIFRRLPPEYKRFDAVQALAAHTDHLEGAGDSKLYNRHEGGLSSRTLGTAVHAFLEELARLRTKLEWDASREALKEFEPRIAARVRATGADPGKASQVAAEALTLALNASHTGEGGWILSPHLDAGNEVRWAGIVDGALRTVRADRVFRAGLVPQAEGDAAWWIIDYKTAHAGDSDHYPAELFAEMRRLFAPQLHVYAQMLRNMRGANTVIRAGLYYPRMLLMDWWEL
jgi:hypothetical protein